MIGKGLSSLFLAIILSYSLVPQASGIQQNNSITIQGSTTVVVGTLDLPFPLDDHRITLYATPKISGSSSITSTTSKEMISPNESVNLNLQLSNGKYKTHFDVRLFDVSKSKGTIYIDQTGGTDLPDMDVPGSVTFPTVAIGVVPVPIPILNFVAQFGVSATLKLISSLSVTATGSGVSPQSQKVAFSQTGLQTITFSKSSGIGVDLG